LELPSFFNTSFEAYGSGFQLIRGEVAGRQISLVNIEFTYSFGGDCGRGIAIGCSLFLHPAYRVGKAIRAVSEIRRLPADGIDVDKMISTTFVIGGMAAGAAGVLYGLMFKQVHFFMGLSRGSKRLPQPYWRYWEYSRAMLGGMFIGLSSRSDQSISGRLRDQGSYQLKDASLHDASVVLIFRPTGILGERLAVKKA